MVDYYFDDNLMLRLAGKVVYRGLGKHHATIILDTPQYGKILFMGPDEKNIIMQFSESDEPLYHEAIVHPVMAAHPNPKNVLIIGGGDGGVAREALKHNPKQITLVDIDSSVIELSKKYFNLSQGAFEDPRLKIFIEDGKEFVLRSKDKFEVIIVDLTDPSGPSKMLFTLEFYQNLKSILSPEGLISIQTSAVSEPYILGRISAALKEVFLFTKTYSNFVPVFFDEETYTLASDTKINTNLSPVLKKRKVQLKFYFAEQLEKTVQNPSPLVTRILNRRWEPSTDKKPVESILVK